MELFVAVKCSVYFHEIVGVFSSLDKAIDNSKIFLLNEPDDYHGVKIFKHDLDFPVKPLQTIPINHFSDGQQEASGDLVAEVKRSDAKGMPRKIEVIKGIIK